MNGKNIWELLKREEGIFATADILLHKNGQLLLVVDEPEKIGWITAIMAKEMYTRDELAGLCDDEGTLHFF
ncbi:hypothetical protein [Viridibacillus arvi]|uniref:hypothetical protein n=1 Tax=Viridibacillus arvi TaxID=263475 RepID=UPI0034CD4085